MERDEPIDEKKQVEETPNSVLEPVIQEGASKLPKAAKRRFNPVEAEQRVVEAV